jgi:hypothetical protein
MHLRDWQLQFQRAIPGKSFSSGSSDLPGICPSGNSEGLDEKATKPNEDSCERKKAGDGYTQTVQCG